MRLESLNEIFIDYILRNLKLCENLQKVIGMDYSSRNDEER